MSYRLQLFLVGCVCFLIGWLLAQHLPYAFAQESKTPKWLHGLELRVRRGGEAEFTKDSRKFGIEIFRDENTGNLVYVSDTGSIAVVAGK